MNKSGFLLPDVNMNKHGIQFASSSLRLITVLYLGFELPANHCSPASVGTPCVDESAAQQDNFSVALLSENLAGRSDNSEF